MPDNKKHKLFSKEELFKLIDEKRSLPEGADDFDKEAMEGLAMMKDRIKLEGLDESINNILRLEAAKAKKRRTIYVLSAAASLLLLIGLFFLLKDNMTNKSSSNLAQNKELPNAQMPATASENPAEEKMPGDVTTDENSDVKKPETQSAKESGGEDKDVPKATAGPAEKHDQSLNENFKLADRSNEAEYKKQKLDKAEEADSKTANLETKSRFESNTVWTTPAVGVATANAGAGAGDRNGGLATYDKKPQQEGITRGAEISKNTQDVPSEERSGLVKSENVPAKKSKEKKQETQPDREVSDMLAGYSYYDQKAGTKHEAQKTAEQAPAPNYDAAPVTTGNSLVQTESGKANTTPEKENKVYRNQSEGDDRAGKGEIAQVVAEPKATDNSRTDNGIKSAEFPEGPKALKKYVEKNLMISSPGQVGDVTVEFTVGKDGVIDSSDVKVVSPIKNCDPCGKDVTKLVKKMPKWRPAKDNGIPVETRQQLKVHYDGTRAKK